MAVGDRYFNLAAALRGADIVHAAELSHWFSAQAAAHRTISDFELVLTAWRRVPFGRTYRRAARPGRGREAVLAASDLFLAATERARDAAAAGGSASAANPDPARRGSMLSASPSARPPLEVSDHLIVSPGGWSGRRDIGRAARGRSAAPREHRAPQPVEAAPGRLSVPAPSASGCEATRMSSASHRRSSSASRSPTSDAVAVRERLLHGFGQPADGRGRTRFRTPGRLLGRAVRDGAGRSDGGRPADRRLALGCDPRGRRPDRDLLRAGQLDELPQALVDTSLSAPPGSAAVILGAHRKVLTRAAAERLDAAYRHVLTA